MCHNLYIKTYKRLNANTLAHSQHSVIWLYMSPRDRHEVTQTWLWRSDVTLFRFKELLVLRLWTDVSYRSDGSHSAHANTPRRGISQRRSSSTQWAATSQCLKNRDWNGPAVKCHGFDSALTAQERSSDNSVNHEPVPPYNEFIHLVLKQLIGRLITILVMMRRK